ncbi:MAG: hypothetical protein HY530_08500 [Chloroflexi bacterium]|nr:hypothetical protein [Chloroflexota bacterium]
MKRWSVLIATAMASLTLALTPLLAVAQGEEETTNSEPAVRDALAIVAPRVAPAGQEISMTVFRSWDQETVEGATVWAIAPDRVEALKEAAARLRKDNRPAAEEPDYDALLSAHGTVIGQTDGSGKVGYSFENEGRYMLVAVKEGYLPDFRPIAIGVKPAALAIDAPGRAEVGEQVTITVFQRGTEDAVKDAGVWAVTRDNVESLRAEIAARKQSGDREALQAATEEALSIHGIFLGTSNGSGKVHYAFENAGGYLLVAFKRGYLPGLKPIAIGMTPKALALDAPRRADVGEKITITVLEKRTEEPVKDADVWALTRTDAETLKEQLSSLRESGAERAALQAAIEDAATARGIFLGTSNGSGKVHYAFENAGGYLLIAVKQGYFPAFRPIAIGAMPEGRTVQG